MHHHKRSQTLFKILRVHIHGKKNFNYFYFIFGRMKINLYLCIEQKIKNTMEQTKRKTKKYQVISPDGFTIEFDKPFYRSMKKAKEAFEKWKQRYTKQGYYSSNRGRIPLNDLEQYCDFKVI